MADFYDDDLDAASEEEHAAEQTAQFEAELQRQIALLPPQLYETMQPLLLLGSVASYMLLGHDDDPVPLALNELLGYDLDTLQLVVAATDNPSLARLMAAHTLQLFDFVVVGRLVFESALDEPLRAYLSRHQAPEGGFAGPRQHMLTFGESLLENIAQYLAGTDAELREELHLRRLQTESIFARLDDTLRPYYPPGHSPEEIEAEALDAADAAEDADEPAVHVTFNAGQRVTLSTALRLPYILAELGETAFGRALGGVRRLRRKALERLAARLAASDVEEPLSLSRSELLRLYQAAQVCALSTVTDVMATGSLEDVMRNAAARSEETAEEIAASAHHAREVLLLLMAGFVEVVEVNHPDDEEIAEAKAEISQLAELLAE
ncbi:hypothetical protein KB206_17655 [Microvirga sp. STS02]|uniref:hypothetical protein n=1 Tax=Hymenobacter negativus TaxID=2795026 RepID=UPI0018DB9C09|nr:MULTISPECIES: hypothetical protein [Bacteria]MBH8570723.1 hypothetical protein [Hymenobacter negativus]MBR7210460.1 hypothetical protein [Microvirga sp. STS02]